MKPKQEIATEQSKSSSDQSSQSKGTDANQNQSESVNQKEEEDLPDLKDPEVQKVTSLIQVF